MRRRPISSRQKRFDPENQIFYDPSVKKRRGTLCSKIWSGLLVISSILLVVLLIYIYVGGTLPFFSSQFKPMKLIPSNSVDGSKIKDHFKFIKTGICVDHTKQSHQDIEDSISCYNLCQSDLKCNYFSHTSQPLISDNKYYCFLFEKCKVLAPDKDLFNTYKMIRAENVIQRKELITYQNVGSGICAQRRSQERGVKNVMDCFLRCQSEPNCSHFMHTSEHPYYCSISENCNEIVEDKSLPWKTYKVVKEWDLDEKRNPQFQAQTLEEQTKPQATILQNDGRPPKITKGKGTRIPPRDNVKAAAAADANRATPRPNASQSIPVSGSPKPDIIKKKPATKPIRPKAQTRNGLNTGARTASAKPGEKVIGGRGPKPIPTKKMDDAEKRKPSPIKGAGARTKGNFGTKKIIPPKMKTPPTKTPPSMKRNVKNKAPPVNIQKPAVPKYNNRARAAKAKGRIKRNP